MTAPRYLADGLALCAVVRPGECRLVEVRHDVWCPLLTHRAACVYTPDARLLPPLIERPS